MDSASALNQVELVSFRVEDHPVALIRRDGLHLLEQHWQEVSLDTGIQVLDPDWQTYEALERAGRLWVLTARDQETLIGYTVMMLSHDLHYRSLLVAREDIHFLHPDYRRGLTGYRMLVMTEGAMITRGARKIVFRTKAWSNHGRLFERRKFVKEDIVYSKLVGS